MWRVGYFREPCGFTPPSHCRWKNRFDDPQKKYRTLYSAELPLTCLREVLAPLRPDLKSRREVQELLGKSGDQWSTTHKLKMAWRRRHALAPGRLNLLDGELVDLDDLGTRTELEDALADLLLKHRVQSLDISVIRSGKRAITRTISRFLFDRGAAGVIYGSAIDDKKCIALFEDRAELIPDGPIQLLQDPFPDLHIVCSELGFSLHHFE